MESKRTVIVEQALAKHYEALLEVEKMKLSIEFVGMEMQECIERGNKILLMGNGGSAADCQHIAAEIVGRFNRERESWPAIALTTDTSIITAIANDYGFDQIFSRQIAGLCKRRDIVIGISTSGNSVNVIRGLEAAKNHGAITALLSGGDGGRLRGKCDHELIVPLISTARIQEMHILIGHMLCEILEETCDGKPSK